MSEEINELISESLLNKDLILEKSKKAPNDHRVLVYFGETTGFVVTTKPYDNYPNREFINFGKPKTESDILEVIEREREDNF